MQRQILNIEVRIITVVFTRRSSVRNSAKPKRVAPRLPATCPSSSPTSVQCSISSSSSTFTTMRGRYSRTP